MKFDEIQLGDSHTLTRHFTAADIDAFARLSGDFNPLHVDERYAQQTNFRRRVAHGMLSGAYISTLIGMHLPGAGALWLQQHFDFLLPVFIGDTVEFSARVTHKSPGTRTITLHVEGINQHGKAVLRGQGVVMVLEEKNNPQAVSIGRPLEGQVALVTGGSRGIGAAIAGLLASAGAAVAVNYHRNAAAAAQVVAQIEAAGEQAVALQADVADPDAVNSLTQQTKAAFGKPIDILINNAAGGVAQKAFDDLRWDDMQQHLNVQLKGAFHCCQAVLPGMLAAGGGKIINIGSTYAWGVPPTQLTDYVVAKAALHALTRALAAEYGPKGVQINMVSPGMTETDMLGDIPERTRKLFAVQNPLRRLALPQDVAAVVLLACSSAYLNGANIPVSGGSVM